MYSFKQFFINILILILLFTTDNNALTGDSGLVNKELINKICLNYYNQTYSTQVFNKKNK